MKLDTWEGLTLLVARLGLAPLPHYSSPLKRAIENLENLSERPSSRGDLKKESVSLSCSALFHYSDRERISSERDQVIMRLKNDASLAVWNMD
jgi:hypothetical protein